MAYIVAEYQLHYQFDMSDVELFRYVWKFTYGLSKVRSDSYTEIFYLSLISYSIDVFETPLSPSTFSLHLIAHGRRNGVVAGKLPNISRDFCNVKEHFSEDCFYNPFSFSLCRFEWIIWYQRGGGFQRLKKKIELVDVSIFA